MPSKASTNKSSNSYIRRPAAFETLAPVPGRSAAELDDEEDEEEGGKTWLKLNGKLPGFVGDAGSKITPDNKSNMTTTACVSRTKTENVPSDETVVKVVSLVAAFLGSPSSV